MLDPPVWVAFAGFPTHVEYSVTQPCPIAESLSNSLNPLLSGAVVQLLAPEGPTGLHGLNPLLSGAVGQPIEWLAERGIGGLNPLLSGAVGQREIKK